MSQPLDTLIIGAGTAGLAALREVRKRTERYLIVNEGPWGTTCARVGCMPSKALIEAANAFHRRHAFEAFGLRGAEGLTADIAAVLQRVRALRDQFVAGALQATDTLGAARMAGRATVLGPNAVDIDGTPYATRSIIIATGSGYRELGIPAEKRLSGHGVSWCATCDGFFFRGKEIVVVGGGDSAMEEATFLTRFASKVTIVHRRDEFRASKIMTERALANPKIEVAWNSVVLDLLGDESLSGVLLQNVLTGEQTTLPAAGVFIAIGHDPRTELFRGHLELDDEGYIITRPGSTATSIDGVFAAGDVVDHTYRQAITAAGTGCSAALDCERWLAERD